MTTTVKILIEGNKACEVSIQDTDGATPRDPSIVKPGSFVTKGIHGEQTVRVVETGEFLT